MIILNYCLMIDLRDCYQTIIIFTNFKMEITYQDFMNSKNIYHSNELLSRIQEGYMIFAEKENEYDMISYNDIKTLSVINLGSSNYAMKITATLNANISTIKINEDKKYYFDYYFDFDKEVDIIDNIDINTNGLNANISFIINNEEYQINEITELLICVLNTNADNKNYKLRIIFNEIPNESNLITITEKKYLLKLTDKQFLQNNKIICDHIIYDNGSCYRKVIND